MQGTHRSQVNQHLGREILFVTRQFEGQTQDAGEEYTEVEETIDARIEDMTSLGQDDSGLEKIGQIPDDGIVIFTSDPNEVDEDDQFEVDGTRFDILEVVEKTGDAGKTSYFKAYCKPDR